MNLYENNLSISSDFEIRTIREDENDKDIIISIDKRTVNLIFPELPSYISNRIQLLEVQNIIIRFAKNSDNNICTVHILRSIDLHSSIMNFELNYSKLHFELTKKTYSVNFNIKYKE